VSLASEMLGRQVLLSGGEVDKLLAARARYGTMTAAKFNSGCFVTSPAPAGVASGLERIWVTRAELEALIEEAVREDRKLR
jgi:hypothetical protein